MNQILYRYLQAGGKVAYYLAETFKTDVLQDVEVFGWGFRNHLSRGPWVFISLRTQDLQRLADLSPRFLKITLHTFRHWKATMEYHKTRDVIHVQQLLGYRDIQNTMVYITIEKTLFQTRSDEFYCKTAKTVEEATRLIEAGFNYVTTFNGIMLFRKRK